MGLLVPSLLYRWMTGFFPSRSLLAICIVSLMAGLAINPLAQAQPLAAGQVTGTIYTDLAPGILVTALQTLDIDNDGTPDIKLNICTGCCSSRVCLHYSNLKLLHTNVNVLTTHKGFPGYVSYTLYGLESKEVITSTTPTPSDPRDTTLWLNNQRKTYTDDVVFYYSQSNPVGFYTYGTWVDRKEHYMGIRIRSAATGNWRYGWIRIQSTNDSSGSPSGLIVKDYALTTTILAAQPAQAAGWQIYPTLVADQLTIEPPAGANNSQATIIDLCGRKVLTTNLTSTSRQLHLTALAAGVYVVQLDTPTGRFIQRICKQ